MTPSHVTTHILDTSNGLPASGVTVQLARQRGGTWEVVADGTTDADGRVRTLGPQQLDRGVYRLTFGTGAYFAARGMATFFPAVELQFELANPSQHYHVPLLLSPFSYSTYRGS